MVIENALPRTALFKSYTYLIISLCSLFLFYKYVLQIYPSVITESLMKEFNLDGAGLGNLVGNFYYSFMVAQLFVGYILDKFSARWVTSGAILLCAIGVIWFSNSHTVMSACLSRALMGIGVAFATVAYMKLAAVWFPPRQYALIGGLLASAAMAGAVAGEAPLSWLMNAYGWRECLFMVGMAGVVLTLAFAITVRDAPASERAKPVTHTVSLKDMLSVLKNKQNWLLTLYGGLAFSPVAVFGGLWGNPFIQQAYNLDQTQAATFVSLAFIGLGFGSPMLGALSNRLGDRKYLLFLSPLISGIAITLVLYAHPMPIWLMATLLFTFGFALGAFMLVFTIGKELNSLYLTATVIGMINASDAVLDGLTEPGIGKLLDLFWDGKIVNNVHYFSLNSYHIALAILPVYLFVAAALVFWIKTEGSVTEKLA
jgi:nitrate/nitrite transporter NarK